MESVTWRDNPILIKHLRSRLRQHEVWPAATVVLLLCGFVTWLAASKAQTPAALEGCYRVFVGLQGVILFLLGTAQVFSSVFRARESNVLDFHRISPLSALTLVVGFVVGAPIREYLLFALTLPFSLYAVANGAVPLLGWLIVTGAMLVAAVLYHLLSLVVALVSERGKAGYGVVSAAVLLLYAASKAAPFTFFTIIPAYRLMLDSLGPDLQPALANFSLGLLHQALLIIFLTLGATRRMRREESPFWSKPLALVLFFLVARLASLDIKQMGHDDPGWYMAIPALYCLWLAAVGLAGMATPSQRDFLRGVRRARRLGTGQAPLWGDAAPNRMVLVALAVLLGLAGATLPLSSREETTASAMALAAVVASLSLLGFGAAMQAFSLHYRRKSRPYFWFLLFVLYIVPLLVSGTVAMFPDGKTMAQYFLAMSPLAALGLVAAGSKPVVTGIALATNGCLAAFFAWKAQACEREASAQVSA